MNDLSQVYRSLDLKRLQSQRRKTMSLVDLYDQVLRYYLQDNKSNAQTQPQTQASLQTRRRKFQSLVSNKLSDLSGSQKSLTPRQLRTVLLNGKLRKTTETQLRRYLLSFLPSSPHGLRQLLQGSSLDLLGSVLSNLSLKQREKLPSLSVKLDTRVQQTKQRIETLDFTDISPGKILEFFQTELPKHKNLKSLNLGYNGIREEGIRVLAPALTHLTRLTSLNLGDNGIREEGIKVLVPALTHLTRLTSLDLSSNGIGGEGMRVLAPALTHLTRLTSLNLGWNKIGEEGIKVLAPALTHLTHLTSLDLRRNDIREEGMRVLAPALTHLTRLTSLNLSGNGIGEEGMRVLTPALTHLTHLTSLNLSQNGIGEEGIRVLTPALTHLTHLTSLDLGWNRIGDEGIRVLAPALTHLTHLTSLNLGWNKIGDEGIRVLAPALTHLTHLTSLDLRRNDIREEGMRTLLQEFVFPVHYKMRKRGDIELLTIHIGDPLLPNRSHVNWIMQGIDTIKIKFFGR